MITWIGAVLLMFAAIVPNSPSKTLIASLIAVSMSPLGMLVAAARGVNMGPASNLLLMHFDGSDIQFVMGLKRLVTRLEAYDLENPVALTDRATVRLSGTDD
jgi:hypothetical protein